MDQTEAEWDSRRLHRKVEFKGWSCSSTEEQRLNKRTGMRESRESILNTS